VITLFNLGITKESYNILCVIYKAYLQKRKNDIPKRQAKNFDSDISFHTEYLPTIHFDDLYAAIVELSNFGYLKKYVDGGFILTDEGIILMENKFKNNLSDVMNFISDIPFI